MKKTVLFYISAVCLLMLPRIVRYLYPEIYIEDDFYLQNAFLMTTGLRPYQDFILNHFPLLELFLKKLFEMFGASIETAEIVNQFFIFLNSILILIIGMRIKDRFTGLAAAFLYASSAHVFTYHVFEREIFTNTCVLIGMYSYFFLKKENTLKYVLIGLIYFLSALIKFTGAIPMVLLVACSLYEKRFKSSAILLVSFLLPLGLATLFFYSQYGYAFYLQVFLFQFLKGSRSFLGRARLFVRGTDFSLFLGCLGFLFYRREEWKKEWIIIRIAFVIYPFFFLCLSSTVWPHNLIDMLPFACFLGGAFLSMLRTDSLIFIRCRIDSHQTIFRKSLIAFFILSLFCFTKPWIACDADEPYLFYGFGNIPRREIAEIGRYLRDNTQRDDFIFCPFPILALTSNRRTIMNYWENVGVEAWAKESLKEHGFFKTIRKARAIYFTELFSTYTKNYTYERFWKEVASNKIPLLVKLNPNQKLKLSFAHKNSQELLDYCSGKRLISTKHFEVFTFSRKPPIKVGRMD